MLYITTKLRRLKALQIVAIIILFPIRIPLFVIYYSGKAAELIDDVIVGIYYKFQLWVVRRLKWDEVARKQYKENPRKFRD